MRKTLLTLITILMLTISMFSQDYSMCTPGRGGGHGFQGIVYDLTPPFAPTTPPGIPADGEIVYAVMQEPPYETYYSVVDSDGFFGTDIEGQWTWHLYTGDGRFSRKGCKGCYLPQCYLYNIVIDSPYFRPNPFYVRVSADFQPVFQTFWKDDNPFD